MTKRPTIEPEMVIRRIAEYYGIPVEALTTTDRITKQLRIPYREAIWACKNVGAGTEQIAAAMNQRNSSGISYHSLRFEADLQKYGLDELRGRAKELLKNFNWKMQVKKRRKSIYSLARYFETFEPTRHVTGSHYVIKTSRIPIYKLFNLEDAEWLIRECIEKCTLHFVTENGYEQAIN